MADPHANFAYSTVATAPSPAASGTSLVVASGEGARFPSGTFNVVVWPAGAQPLASNAEILRGSFSGDTFTMARTQEGTSARTIVAGDQIALAVTAKMFTDAEGVIAGFFGDGSDGNATISSNTTLSRDMFYDTLTVNSGITLNTGSFRIYCKTALVNNGTISRNGNNATSSAVPSALGSGTLLAAGGTPGAGAVLAGTSASNPGAVFGGLGSAGGAGASGAGGSGGGTAVVANSGSLRSLPQAATGNTFNNGGAGGVVASGPSGGGGGDGTNAGGGPGGGGGFVLINARTVTNNNVISANGGNGFTPTAGNTGGGGAGPGGIVIINTLSFTGNTPTANAGTPGSGNGTGSAAPAGNAGKVLVNVWA